MPERNPRDHGDLLHAITASQELREESRRLRQELADARLESRRFRGVSRIYGAFVDSKRPAR